ncbi:hypothetical protein O3P69_001443 [Scylla paramamosain]|uniref:Uncharacterized protein n=1 Tax=Scylla paramamosain TaxID=85552 RepID=A0AAW0UXK1_SCYPA
MTHESQGGAGAGWGQGWVEQLLGSPYHFPPCLLPLPSSFLSLPSPHPPLISGNRRPDATPSRGVVNGVGRELNATKQQSWWAAGGGTVGGRDDRRHAMKNASSFLGRIHHRKGVFINTQRYLKDSGKQGSHSLLPTNPRPLPHRLRLIHGFLSCSWRQGLSESGGSPRRLSPELHVREGSNEMSVQARRDITSWLKTFPADFINEDRNIRGEARGAVNTATHLSNCHLLEPLPQILQENPEGEM